MVAVSRMRLCLAWLPYFAIAATIDLSAFATTGHGGLLVLIALWLLGESIKHEGYRLSWLIDERGVGTTSVRSGLTQGETRTDYITLAWTEIDRAEIDLRDTPYRRLRVSSTDGRSCSIPIGLFSQRKQIEESIKALGAGSPACAALISPREHSFRDPGVRHSVLIFSALGLLVVVAPYLAWIYVAAEK